MTIGRRNVEGGGRDDDYNHTDYRMVGGMKGDIAKGLTYDLSYDYSKALFDHAHYNDFSLTRVHPLCSMPSPC